MIILYFIFNTQQTKQIIEGEFASLQALQWTNTVRKPNPIKVSLIVQRFANKATMSILLVSRFYVHQS